MKSAFCPRIAAENLKKNPRLYVPRILAESGLLASFYIMITLASDKRLSECLGGSYLPLFMTLGAIIIGLLSFILILYVNSFLMKQRKSEYGLYNVLGLEKRHIIRLLFCESAFSSLLSYVAGLACGILFYKLATLFICRLLHAETAAGVFYLKASCLLLSAGIFVAFDLFAFFVNSMSILRMKPTELIAEKHTGEREPRIRWALLIIGILTLGAGYAIALSVKSPLEAILLFFGAVILVIIGTYCLFVTGTTFVLKCLKRNKKYYYRKRHMPAVSGLLFRIKQNAVGLASIAILATGVLVMISTTVSLYSGVEDTMDRNYPMQLYLSVSLEEEGGDVKPVPASELEDVIRRSAAELGLEISGRENEQYLSVAYLREGNVLYTEAEAHERWSAEDITGVVYITAKTYRELTGAKITLDSNALTLNDDEIAYCSISTAASKISAAPSVLTVHGKTYKVKKEIDHFPVSSNWGTVVNVIGVIVSDDSVLKDIYLAQKASLGEHASEMSDRIGIGFADEEVLFDAGEALTAKITDEISRLWPGNKRVALDAKWEALSNVLGMYGTFLFLGILLGLVCLFSTILIIYYKQISEGYEDRGRFQIMQKIGMEKAEVKRTIGSQLRLQFFLPLATAGVHTAVAFPILLKLLRILMLTNTALFIVCTLITYAVFALVYTVIFSLTKRTYYKIVH